MMSCHFQKLFPPYCLSLPSCLSSEEVAHMSVHVRTFHFYVYENTYLWRMSAPALPEYLHLFPSTILFLINPNCQHPQIVSVFFKLKFSLWKKNSGFLTTSLCAVWKNFCSTLLRACYLSCEGIAKAIYEDMGKTIIDSCPIFMYTHF